MASIHLHAPSGTYRISFRYGGKQYQKSLKTTDEKEANNRKGSIEQTLSELERGRKELPEGADLWEFLESDGKRTQKVKAPTVVTLNELCEQWEAALPPGTMEKNSLATDRIHLKHIRRLLGSNTSVASVTPSDLQGYINRRAKEKTNRGTLIQAETIKKEIKTLKKVWTWGRHHAGITAEAPVRELRYPKDDEKPGFMTWEEIERRVNRGGLTEQQVDALWEALFLNKEQIAECLKHVQATATLPFVHPMFVFVAHTGARRSEMLRSQVEDFDFETKKVQIRERKRKRKKKESSRYVDMTGTLERVMKEWFASGHPGGKYSFCMSEVLMRSRKRSMTTGHQSGKGRATTNPGRQSTVHERTERPGHVPLTEDEASDHFDRTLAGSKWSVLKGFHVFRHSFASNLAAAGERPDVIDNYMGHQTEEMRRRYRHLFPHETAGALRRLFDE